MNATAVTVSTLQATVARALAQSPEARGRIERASVLIALGAVEQHDAATYAVTSQTGDGTVYVVTPGGCTCMDAQRHPGQRCKHQWAVRITLAAQIQERRESEQAERATVSADTVALAYARRIGWAA
jgi:hypothetical protein